MVNQDPLHPPVKKQPDENQGVVNLPLLLQRDFIFGAPVLAVGVDAVVGAGEAEFRRDEELHTGGDSCVDNVWREVERVGRAETMASMP